jgi:hypothetical protein
MDPDRFVRLKLQSGVEPANDIRHSESSRYTIDQGGQKVDL